MSTPNTSKVKWTIASNLTQDELQYANGDPMGTQVPVIPLDDLTELVEGLRILSGIPGEYPAELLAEFKAVAYDPDDDECLSFSQWLSQRLLAQLEARRKEGA